MTNNETNTLPNTDNDESVAWFTDSEKFRDLISGNPDFTPLMTIPACSPEQFPSLLNLWNGLQFQPSLGDFAYEPIPDRKDGPPFGATPWGRPDYSGEALLRALRGAMGAFHFRLQNALADVLADHPELSTEWLSTRKLQWRLGASPYDPTAGPVILPQSSLPPGHHMIGRLADDCLDRGNFVLQDKACIISRDRDRNLDIGGPLPLLPVKHVLACTLAASQPARDAAEWRKQLAEREQREIAAYAKDHREKHRVDLLEKQLAEIRAKLEQHNPAAAK